MRQSTRWRKQVKHLHISLVQYELYRMETGALVKKNSLPVSGGTIKASGVSNSLYLLKIVTGETVESHKIILK